MLSGNRKNLDPNIKDKGISPQSKKAKIFVQLEKRKLEGIDKESTPVTSPEEKPPLTPPPPDTPPPNNIEKPNSISAGTQSSSNPVIIVNENPSPEENKSQTKQKEVAAKTSAERDGDIDEPSKKGS